MLIFEWDSEKARENEQKHQVTFTEAVEVFEDDHSSAVSDQTTRCRNSVTLSLAFRGKASIWLCPILNVRSEFD